MQQEAELCSRHTHAASLAFCCTFGALHLEQCPPEVDVLMIEDVALLVDVMEALGAEHHAHIVAGIQKRQHLQEKQRVCHLEFRACLSGFKGHQAS